jgi:hypothetical protein
MKRFLQALAIIIILLSIFFTGCSSGGIAQSDYDNLQAQLTDTQNQLTQALADLDAAKAVTTTTTGQTSSAELDAANARIADLEQQITDLQAVGELIGATKADTAANIVRYYYEHHYYEKGVYDCNNMADDVWDMLKDAGIEARIVIGSIDTPLNDILLSDHAWVLANVGSGTGGYIALDATNGEVVTKEQNALYYRGWYFNDPAQVKANDDLRTQYNTIVAYMNSLVHEINDAMQAYNNSSNQTEADKYLTLYNKLVELKAAQEIVLNSLNTQINSLATPFSL